MYVYYIVYIINYYMRKVKPFVMRVGSVQSGMYRQEGDTDQDD